MSENQSQWPQNQEPSQPQGSNPQTQTDSSQQFVQPPQSTQPQFQQPQYAQQPPQSTQPQFQQPQYAQQPPQYAQQPPKPPRSGSRWWTGCFISIALVIAFFFVCGYLLHGCGKLVTDMVELADKADSPIPRNSNHKEKILLQGGSDRICVIDIKGVIARQENAGVCTPKIIALLKQIEKDSTIKALILDMDSPGGEVIASDEINSAIWKLRNARNIPVITCMHSMGASGGYYIASATDYIIANRMTFTGSIGVIMSSVNATELMDKIGLKSTAFTSGDMKDMLSPTRPMTEKELAYTKAMIHETFTEFAKVVAKGREAFKTHEEVMAAEFADGRVLSGAAALGYGLVDELGGFDEAVAKACELAKIENPTIMQLQPKQSLMDILMSANTQVKPLSLNGILPIQATSLEAGKLYYIAPQAITQ